MNSSVGKGQRVVRGIASRVSGRHASQLEAKIATLRDDRVLIKERLAETRAELAKTRRKLATTERRLAGAAERLVSAYDAPVSDDVASTIEKVRKEHLTYLSAPYLRGLASHVSALDEQGLDGAIIEAGTARGGSAIVMAAAKSAERPMFVYDVFGMIPPPSEADGQDVHARYATIVEGKARGVGGDTYYGYRDELYDEVTESFARCGVPVDQHRVELVRGLFEDTIVLDQPVALAHLDGDWYESTMVCLDRIAPLLVPGGRLVLDDYYSWSGCRTAVDEYFADRPGYRMEPRAKLHVVRE